MKYEGVVINGKVFKPLEPLYYFDPWTECVERAAEWQVEYICEDFGEHPNGLNVLVKNSFGWLAINPKALFQDKVEAVEHYKRVLSNL